MTVNWKKVGLFAWGTLFGTAGIKILSSDDAKKVYTHCLAAILRGRKYVMDVADTVQENCSDILSEAKAINEERISKKEMIFEDLSEKERA